jgi:UDP-N-acetylglucosamine 1-carboxyvinyltransferase
VDVITHEYPGFPTDLQAPFTVLLTQATGLSMVFETIFESRLFYTDMLNQMGGRIIMCDPHRVIVSGPTPLFGRKLTSPDLRAGFAMVLAALAAEGTTEIDNIYQIDRGYSNLEKRLQNIGAEIKRIVE